MIEEGKPEFWLDDDGNHVHWFHHCRASWGDVRNVDTLLPNSASSWQVVNEDPLTVTPSIRCMACGLHGFIIEGEWVDV